MTTEALGWEKERSYRILVSTEETCEICAHQIRNENHMGTKVIPTMTPVKWSSLLVNSIHSRFAVAYYHGLLDVFCRITWFMKRWPGSTTKHRKRSASTGSQVSFPSLENGRIRDQ